MSKSQDYPVNLPKTSFAMRAQLAKREPEMLKKWLDEGHYDELRHETATRSAEYLFHDGPPYANGEIHIGHALNKVLKDMSVRSRLLDGYASKFVPGWDCHGLPIELKVERSKKKGIKGKDNVQNFQRACREYALTQVEQQREAFGRLGLVTDFGEIYLTMQPKVEAATLESLGTLVERGLVTRRRMPVLWCSHCRSSLAEAETEYADLTSPAIYAAFPVVDSAQVAAAFGVSNAADAAFLAWTTTPWTIFANRALAVGKDIPYSLVRFDGDARLYVLATSLAETIAESIGSRVAETIATTTGEKLLGTVCHHPFYPRQAPVVPANHVTDDAGTGVVHMAPSHGREDYDACLAYGIEVDDLVDDRARFRDEVVEAAGMTMPEASQQSIALLREAGNLLAASDYLHSYPTCWRHKKPLIYRATWQWFIELSESGILARARELVDTVTWYPSSGRDRMLAMLENRPDWCISRQRSWGVPLPFFINRATGELHPESDAFLKKVVEKVREEGIECWNSLTLSDLKPDADEAELEQYDKTSDVLDVWFDSGNTYRSVGDGQVNDLYLEGVDQFRGWFQAALILSTALDDRAPYLEVLTHGFLVDSRGEKMSKSKGNITKPHEICGTLGADVLRMWVASADTRGEIAFNDEVLNQVVDRYRKLRNTLRFLLGNLHDFDPTADSVAPEGMLLLDRWVMSRAQELEQQVLREYRGYAFHSASRALHMLAVDLSSSYFDVVKDRLYCSTPDGRARRSAQTTMYLLGDTVARLLSVIAPFTAQEVWESLPQRPTKNVMSAEFLKLADSSPEGNWLSASESTLFNDLLEPLRVLVFKEIEAARQEERISMPLAASVELQLSPQDHARLGELTEELHYFFVVSSCTCVSVDGLSEPQVSVTPAPGTRCVRCRLTVDEPQLADEKPCTRCAENLAGNEAKRDAF